jgi:hypothetical protein
MGNPNLKSLQGEHILSAEFFTLVLDSLPDYSIFTVDKQSIRQNRWCGQNIAPIW